MDVGSLKRNIEALNERIALALQRRGGGNVDIVAATKTVDAQTVCQLVELGISEVGENRVQEYIAKRDAVQGAKWHFIGTLQRNKVKYLVGKVELIQSVSSVALADEIDKQAGKLGVNQRVLVELNASEEAGKTGALRADIDGLIEHIGALKNVTLCGLMAIPAREAAAQVYKNVRDVFERYESERFSVLSVGMSGDYERAIQYGSNMVRIGTALFGARNYIGR